MGSQRKEDKRKRRKEKVFGSKGYEHQYRISAWNIIPCTLRLCSLHGTHPSSPISPQNHLSSLMDFWKRRTRILGLSGYKDQES
jgi:hypothetical protein